MTHQSQQSFNSSGRKLIQHDCIRWLSQFKAKSHHILMFSDSDLSHQLPSLTHIPPFTSPLLNQSPSKIRSSYTALKRNFCMVGRLCGSLRRWPRKPLDSSSILSILWQPTDVSRDGVCANGSLRRIGHALVALLGFHSRYQ